LRALENNLRRIAIEEGRVFCAAAVVSLVVCFVWLSFPVAVRGLSSADDTFLALAAKTVASGSGYGIPISSGHLVLFAPEISTGATLILPVALFIRIFGALDSHDGG